MDPRPGPGAARVAFAGGEGAFNVVSVLDAAHSAGAGFLQYFDTREARALRLVSREVAAAVARRLLPLLLSWAHARGAELHLLVSLSLALCVAKASDALSVITEMSFSIDDGPWQLGAAADGIFDDQIEALRIELPAELSRGSHTLAIRVADAGGNIGSTSTTFVVK